jgi:hypothetical protein
VRHDSYEREILSPRKIAAENGRRRLRQFVLGAEQDQARPPPPNVHK